MTFLLDTNILSEPVYPIPNVGVMQKLQIHGSEVVTATLVWHELLFGVFRLPASKRRKSLESYLLNVVLTDIPLLPYDARAARWHAEERARLVANGFTPTFIDGQIAAVAAVNNLTVVTRNVSDYKAFRNLKVVSWHS